MKFILFLITILNFAFSFPTSLPLSLLTTSGFSNITLKTNKTSNNFSITEKDHTILYEGKLFDFQLDCGYISNKFCFLPDFKSLDCFEMRVKNKREIMCRKEEIKKNDLYKFIDNLAWKIFHSTYIEKGSDIVAGRNWEGKWDEEDGNLTIFQNMIQKFTNSSNYIQEFNLENEIEIRKLDERCVQVNETKFCGAEKGRKNLFESLTSQNMIYELNLMSIEMEILYKNKKECYKNNNLEEVLNKLESYWKDACPKINIDEGECDKRIACDRKKLFKAFFPNFLRCNVQNKPEKEE